MKIILGTVPLVGMAMLLVGVFSLSGCAADADRTKTDTGWVTAQYVKLPDGRQVICVMSDTTISCDWEGAK